MQLLTSAAEESTRMAPVGWYPPQQRGVTALRSDDLRAGARKVRNMARSGRGQWKAVYTAAPYTTAR